MIKLADTLTPMSNDFYAVESENVGINIDGTSKSIQQAYEDGDLSGGGSAIQVDTMPIASEYPNEIVQYVGESGTYQNGYFYQSTSDEQNPPTYSWVQKNVQPNAESFTFNEDDFNIDSSTDEVSLLPSRRVFNGTKADWDLLSVAEKTQYGATAFTDDEGVSGDVKTISLTQNTNSAYKIIELKAIRMGNIVNVIGVVEIIAQIESLIIATGFPPPLIVQDTVNDTQIYLSGQRGTNNIGQSARITKNGELIVYTSTSGGNYYFSGSYIV